MNRAPLENSVFIASEMKIVRQQGKSMGGKDTKFYNFAWKLA